MLKTNAQTLVQFSFFFLSLIFISVPLKAQELKVEYEAINPSSKINDAYINLVATGGTPPYQYKWSKGDTPLTSNRSTGLTEGITHNVIVSDKTGASKELTIKIPAESITEIFNGTAVPAVNWIGSILFWDPFSAIGIYDPVVYAEGEPVSIPDWTPDTNEVFTLKKRLVSDGQKVKKNIPIAIIKTSSGQEIEVLSKASGVIEFKNNEGEIIYDSNNSEHVIQQGAHYFARIEYDEKVPLLQPNGDIQKKNIPFIVVWLLFGAVFFTIKMGFINLRGFKHALDLVRGKYDDPKAPGQVTHFQALATAVSGTVGLGNIAGVAVAVSVGGAGATFWMIIAGLLGMSSKFVECTLGVKYRFINEEGRVFGGPMNYLRYGLAKQGKATLGKILAAAFAVLAIGASFGGGNMFQANQSFAQLESQFPMLEGKGFMFGVVTAILVGAVIIGGIRSIAKVTGKIVPLMAGIYILASLVVIGINIENVGMAFQAIINGAFSPTALKGGFIGVLIVGFQRAAFSNEAGVGSAAIAHSAAKTSRPPSEGFVALLEPFIDTVVVCTLTALVLIFTGKHEVAGMSGAQLTSDAFASVIAWFPYVLAFAVFLFAFSTMISWSYYGMRAWTYLFGKSKKIELIYKLTFLLFVVIGASVSLGAVLDFSDMMILAMSFPNIIGLLLMSKEVREDLREYMVNLKAGKFLQKSKD